MISVDFKQIEAFVNVAKFKSFSKAGEAIYLSQPTISTHINTLENELNTALFDRMGKEVQLTPAGTLFFEYALDILNKRKQALSSIADFQSRMVGEISIASSTTPCKYILPYITGEFLKIYPDISFKISGISSGEVISKVLNFQAELGIVGEKILDEKLTYFELADDMLTAVTPVNNKFNNVKNQSVFFKDLECECFILREPSSATRQIFESALVTAGYNISKLKVLSEVSSLDAALQFVRYGIGITIISENAAREYIDSNYVKSFHIKDLALNRKIYLVKHSKRTLSPPAKAYLELAKSLYKSAV